MTTPQVPTNTLDYATAGAADIITTVFDWGVPSVRTDAEDDAPGSTAYIAASGFRVGSNINFAIEVIDPETHAHLWTGPVWDVANGSPTDGENCADRTVLTQFSGTRDYADTTIRLKALDRATGQTATTIFIDSNGSLSDWQDGPAPSGNFRGSKPHYAEGESVPFEVVFTGLTTETTYSITLTWDTTKAGLHAFDYLTNYNYSWAASHPQEPTQFPDPIGTSLFAASNVTACDPAGGGAAGGPVASTLTIPVGPVLAKATPTAQASGQVVGLWGGNWTGNAADGASAYTLSGIGDSDGDHGTTSGTLAVGETWTLAATTHTVTSAEIDVGGTLTNVATFSDRMVAAESDDTATVTATVSQHPNLTVSKTEDPPQSVRPDDPLKSATPATSILPPPYAGREYAVSWLTNARLVPAVWA